MKFTAKIISFAFFLLTFSILGQQPQIAPSEPEVGIVEHLDELIDLDVELINESDQKVILRDLIDKPTVIALVYFRCPGICSPLMEGIADVIDNTDLSLVRDYQVFTISFDPSEHIDLGRRKKTNYLNLMQKQDAAVAGWKFFISDSLNIARLTGSVGFKYKRTGLDFLHPATLIILSPEGKITRYMNGTYFLPFEFKMSIIDASEGKSGPTINRILQFCYSYDPAAQQYVLNITRVTGTLILFIALVFFFILAIKPLFRKKKAVKDV
ncbi:MAG: SCO family protein [Bacteroidales bacterium]|nr:MAG: SCO family protein [Bacteroidales bacterium]